MGNEVIFEKSPPCCRKSLEKVHDILESAHVLQELLAVAPDLVKPTIKISKLGALWRLGSSAWKWRQNRKITQQALAPIVKNRVNTVIDFELLRHDNDPPLKGHWTKLKNELNTN